MNTFNEINESQLLSKLEKYCESHKKFSVAYLDFDKWKNKVKSLEELNKDFREVLKHSRVKEYYYFGNDEYILFFFDGFEEAFQELIELKMSWEAHRKYKITYSIGLVTYPTHGKKAEDIYRGAEAALYRAKQEGRNKISQPEKGKLILKSNYYYQYQLERLKIVAEKSGKYESDLLRLALDEFFRRHDDI